MKKLERSRIRPSRDGFTLLEMLIVLAIILVVAAMVVPNLLAQQRKANIKQTEGSIKAVEKAIELLSVEYNGNYPPGDDQFLWRINEPQWEDDFGNIQERVFSEDPVDAWGNDLHYRWDETGNPMNPEATKPAIWSNGPNGTDEQGGGDDIKNWSDDQ